MRKPLPLVVLLLTAPAGLVGFEMWRQDAAQHGPAGGSGVVEGNDVVLASRLAARVVSVPVREGQPVAKGDVLLTLDCAEPDAALA
jgi:HlyD family secretion protein